MPNETKLNHAEIAAALGGKVVGPVRIGHGQIATPGNAEVFAENTEPPSEEAGMTSLDSQVGGDHYRSMAIQPAEFIHRNGLGYLEGSAIKYICRHGRKPGVSGRDDLDKAIHFLTMLRDFTYGKEEA